MHSNSIILSLLIIVFDSTILHCANANSGKQYKPVVLIHGISDRRASLQGLMDRIQEVNLFLKIHKNYMELRLRLNTQLKLYLKETRRNASDNSGQIARLEKHRSPLVSGEKV
jgi:hypothetical protein